MHSEYIGATQRTNYRPGRSSVVEMIRAEQTSWSPSSTPPWVSRYLTAMHQMVEEADLSSDPRVKLTALRILELQKKTIQELELENWADSLL